MHPKVSQKEKKRNRVRATYARLNNSESESYSVVSREREREGAKFAIDSCGGPAVCALLNIEYIQARVICIYKNTQPIQMDVEHRARVR